MMCGDPQLGACCVTTSDGSMQCIETDETHCLDEGGDWHGAGTTCADAPCGGGQTGACCINGGCLMLMPSDCEMVHGLWNGGGCGDTVCPAYCPGDVDGDGTVGVNDILIVIANWGPCM
ncbi:MAG TPA: hypothetical protein QF800_05710 [Phycisphaerales bacterium]|nr:hypothetical protein [Phycisphaerales bacterium]